MKSSLSISLVALGLAALAGCMQRNGDSTTQSSRAGGGVGVVDLDAVAKALGRDLEMQADAEKKLGQYTSELASLQSALNRQLQDKKEEIGDEPSDDDVKTLVLTQRQLETQFRESKSKAERRLLTHKQRLIEQFREETKPVVREIADRRGLSIVIPKNDALLLTVSTDVDLTDAVVLAMQKTARPSHAEAEAAKPKRKPAAAETSLRD